MKVVPEVNADVAFMARQLLALLDAVLTYL
jgi:hypothetical protein